MGQTKHLRARFSFANCKPQFSEINFTWLITNCFLQSGYVSTQAANQSRAKLFVDSYLQGFSLTYWFSKCSHKSHQHHQGTC